MRLLNVKLTTIAFLFCIMVNDSFANLPFLTDDPTTVDYHHWEVDVFANILQNKVDDDEPDLVAPAFEIDWGALPNVQLHITVPYAWSIPPAAPAAHGMGDIEAGVEYRFIQENTVRPQVAIYPVVELPTGDGNRNLGNGKIWYKLPIWMQKNWGKWTLDAGGGYAINQAKGNRNYIYAGCFIANSVTDQLTLGMEVYNQGADSVESRSFTAINLGAGYEITKYFGLSVSGGHSVRGEPNWLGYLGIVLVSS